MAKRPTPKKQQAKSSSSARYKSYANKSRKKLMGMVDNMRKIASRSDAPAKSSKKEVTKIKA